LVVDENEQGRLDYDEDNTRLEKAISIYCEVAHIQYLEQVHCENHEGEDLLLDDATTFKLSVVHKGQVVLFYPILDGKEYCDKHPDQGVSPTEGKPESEYDNGMALKVPKIIGEVVNEGLLLKLFLLPTLEA